MSDNQRLAYDIDTFCKLFSIGRTLTYEQIKKGNLKAVKVGRRTLILAESVSEFASNLQQAGGKNAS